MPEGTLTSTTVAEIAPVVVATVDASIAPVEEKSAAEAVVAAEPEVEEKLSSTDIINIAASALEGFPKDVNDEGQISAWTVRHKANLERALQAADLSANDSLPIVLHNLIIWARWLAKDNSDISQNLLPYFERLPENFSCHDFIWAVKRPGSRKKDEYKFPVPWPAELCLAVTLAIPDAEVAGKFKLWNHAGTRTELASQAILAAQTPANLCQLISRLFCAFKTAEDQRTDLMTNAFADCFTPAFIAANADVWHEMWVKIAATSAVTCHQLLAANHLPNKPVANQDAIKNITDYMAGLLGDANQADHLARLLNNAQLVQALGKKTLQAWLAGDYPQPIKSSLSTAYFNFFILAEPQIKPIWDYLIQKDSDTKPEEKSSSSVAEQGLFGRLWNSIPSPVADPRQDFVQRLVHAAKLFGDPEFTAEEFADWKRTAPANKMLGGSHKYADAIATLTFDGYKQIRTDKSHFKLQCELRGWTTIINSHYEAAQRNIESPCYVM